MRRTGTATGERYGGAGALETEAGRDRAGHRRDLETLRAP